MGPNKNAAGAILALAAAAAIVSGCDSNGSTHSNGSVQPGGVVAGDKHNKNVDVRADNRGKSAPSSPASSAPTSATASSAPTTPAVDGTTQLAAARQVVHDKGYDSYDGQFWNSDHQLNALLGVLSQSADGKYQHVFFFVDGRYIGLDASAASGSVHIVGASNDVITVSYGIYKPTDVLAMASSRQQVRFEWTGSKLVPLDPIPLLATGTAAGR